MPEGFCATVVADELGPARHLTVDRDGDVYVLLRRAERKGGIVALRDTNGDGKADRTDYFSSLDGTGIAVHNGYLYVSPGARVVRFPLGDNNELVPSKEFQTVVSKLYSAGQHKARPITFDDRGNFYVNIGAPSNNCMKQTRTKGSPGQDPCPLLDYAGGIWQFKADSLNQTQQEAVHYARGIRNAVAIDWNERTGHLYAVQHGRDQLHSFFPELYSVKENARLPAEEFLRVDEGSDLGWPYCYYDQEKKKYVLAPEYGGDGEQVGRCGQYPEPIYGFPGHYAPNDLLFYTGSQFPDRYQNGAFVGFHGSWNRAPLPQRGYHVGFLPMRKGSPSVKEPKGYEKFADGFAGRDTIDSPGNAEYRPMGLAQGPDGSLYISDSQQGRVWRVFYTEE